MNIAELFLHTTTMVSGIENCLANRLANKELAQTRTASQPLSGFATTAYDLAKCQAELEIQSARNLFRLETVARDFVFRAIQSRDMNFMNVVLKVVEHMLFWAEETRISEANHLNQAIDHFELALDRMATELDAYVHPDLEDDELLASIQLVASQVR